MGFLDGPFDSQRGPFGAEWGRCPLSFLSHTEATV